MLNHWLFVGMFMILSIAAGAAPIVVARFFGPHKPNRAKQEAYECGMETVGDTWVQFKVQYYLFALVFVVFDVETVFLFPWAVAYNQMSLFAVCEGVLFILILGAGLVYAWQKGALEWV